MGLQEDQERFSKALEDFKESLLQAVLPLLARVADGIDWLAAAWNRRRT